MKLTFGQLRTLADVLEQLSKISRETGIDFIGALGLELQYAGNSIRVAYENEQYIIDEIPGC